MTDFLSLFEQHIKNSQKSGNELKGLCPFHEDSKQSFSVNLDTGLWTCYAACGGGNAYQFAQKVGIDPKPYFTNKTPGNGESKPSVTPKQSDMDKALMFHNYLMSHWDTLGPKQWHKGIIKECKVGYDSKLKCFTFPILNIEGKLDNLRWHKGPQIKGIHGTFWFPKQFINNHGFKERFYWCEGEPDT